MKIDFSKHPDGLVPAIIQDAQAGKVLMLGYMNEVAYSQTTSTGNVVFYSRSRKRLWMKGEESGNVLRVQELLVDCDNDTLLIKVNPAGPVCHTGADTCFNEENQSVSFLSILESTIAQRQALSRPSSYTSTLFAEGLNRIAQKVGEEAVELIIAAKDDNPENFLNESADLLFHYLVLLKAKGTTLSDVEDVLKKRHNK